MLISNKSIIDLKVLSKTEASYCLQKSEVCSRQGAGLWHTGRYLQTVQESETKSSTKRKIWVFCGHPLLLSLPSLYFCFPDSTSKASPIYRRENLFLKALIVLAIIGAIFFTAGFLGS